MPCSQPWYGIHHVPWLFFLSLFLVPFLTSLTLQQPRSYDWWYQFLLYLNPLLPYLIILFTLLTKQTVAPCLLVYQWLLASCIWSWSYLTEKIDPISSLYHTRQDVAILFLFKLPQIQALSFYLCSQPHLFILAPSFFSCIIILLLSTSYFLSACEHISFSS